MKSGQKGFTVIETLLVLILLAILGFTGYYVWHSQKQTDNTLNAASHEKLVAPTKKSNASGPSTASAEQTVKAFYAAYIKIAKDNQNGPSADILAQYTNVVTQYGTQSFINNYSKAMAKAYAVDPVLCGQNLPDQGITVTKSTTSSSGNVAVDITQNYSSGYDINASVTVLGGKIDSISCPQP